MRGEKSELFFILWQKQKYTEIQEESLLVCFLTKWILIICIQTILALSNKQKWNICPKHHLYMVASRSAALSCVFKLKPTHLIALFRPDFFYISHLQSLLFLDVMFFATLSVKNSMHINYTLCRLASLHYIHQFVAFWLLSVASSDKHTFRFIFWCTLWKPHVVLFLRDLGKAECGFKCFLHCKCKICCYTTCSQTASAK